MENSHPAVNSQYVVSPHHSPWEFNASSLPLRSPPPPPPFFFLSFSLLFTVFHLLFLCPQNCSSRYPQYLGHWMITYILLNGEPLKSDVELFTIF